MDGDITSEMNVHYSVGLLILLSVIHCWLNQVSLMQELFLIFSDIILPYILYSGIYKALLPTVIVFVSLMFNEREP